ncbi:MAG TPA: MerR family transcriptional regulator [Candidatus Sulfotelmatobacter sp.]|jgi:MerR family redox-sensitive transcriptional activator SoxR|nr:MerR family transcriptional regulator [Candidatus Sulfotelmatobacter sp.]
MAQFTISQVARQAGLQPSAIRYYEKIGVLLPGQRISGRRRYDATVLYRLAVIQRARQSGFTLQEIRQLFFGFRSETRASRRWQNLSRKKLKELDALMAGVESMRSLLKKMTQNCHCTTLDQCGKSIFQREYAQREPAKPDRRSRRIEVTASR